MDTNSTSDRFLAEHAAFFLLSPDDDANVYERADYRSMSFEEKVLAGRSSAGGSCYPDAANEIYDPTYPDYSGNEEARGARRETGLRIDGLIMSDAFAQWIHQAFREHGPDGPSESEVADYIISQLPATKPPLSIEQLAEIVAGSIWSDCDADKPVAQALYDQIEKALGLISYDTLVDVGETAMPMDILLVNSICQGFLFRSWLSGTATHLEALAAEDANAPESETGHPHRAIDAIKNQIMSFAATI